VVVSGARPCGWPGVVVATATSPTSAGLRRRFARAEGKAWLLRPGTAGGTLADSNSFGEQLAAHGRAENADENCPSIGASPHTETLWS